MGRRKPAVDAVELAEVVLKTVAAAEAPLPVSRIWQNLSGPYRVDRARLLSLLRELVAAGRLHEFPPSHGSPQFWDRDAEAYARLLVAETVAARPVTLSDLCKKVAGKLKGYSAARVGQLLEELLEAKRVLEHPPAPGSRSKRYATRLPDPRAYLKKAVEQFDKVCKLLGETGVGRAEVAAALVEQLGMGPFPAAAAPEAFGSPAATAVIPSTGEEAEDSQFSGPASAAPPGDITVDKVDTAKTAERIVAEMHRLEAGAAMGALVSIRALRRSLPDVERSTFDRAAFRLADQGRVTLHRHNYPAGEVPEVRELLLSDERGNYFVGIALRS